MVEPSVEHILISTLEDVVYDTGSFTVEFRRPLVLRNETWRSGVRITSATQLRISLVELFKTT